MLSVVIVKVDRKETYHLSDLFHLIMRIPQKGGFIQIKQPKIQIKVILLLI